MTPIPISAKSKLLISLFFFITCEKSANSGLQNNGIWPSNSWQISLGNQNFHNTINSFFLTVQGYIVVLSGVLYTVCMEIHEMLGGPGNLSNESNPLQDKAGILFFLFIQCLLMK